MRVKSAAQGTSDLSMEISTAPLARTFGPLQAKLKAALEAIADGKTKAACTASRLTDRERDCRLTMADGIRVE